MASGEDPFNKDPSSGDPGPGREPGPGGTTTPVPTPTPGPTPGPPAAPSVIPPRQHIVNPDQPANGDTTFIPRHPTKPSAPIIPGRRRIVTPDPRPGQTVVTPPPTGPPTPILPPPIAVDLPSRTLVFKPNADTPLLPYYGPFGRVGAQVPYAKQQIDGSLVVAYVVSYRCSSIANITIDGAAITSFTSEYEVHLGDPATDPAHTILRTWEPAIVPSGWQPAVCMIVARFPAITAANPQNPDASKFLCDGVGMPLLDHRQDASLVTRFANIAGNVTLQMADFLVDPNFGAGRPLADVWQVPAEWDEAADDCDHIIDGGSTKRYVAGMRLEPRYVDEQINFIRAHASLNINFNNGGFHPWIDKARSAASMSLTSEGSTANIISAGPWEYPGRKQTVTRCRANFIDVQAGYKENSVKSDDPLLASGGVVFVEDVLTLGFVTTDVAQRLVNQRRKRKALGQGAWIRMDAQWLRLLPGVRVPLTSDQLNTSAADIDITDVRSSSNEQFPTMGEVHFEPYSDAIYDDTKVTATAVIPPLNPNPWSTPPEVTGIGGSTAYPTTLYWLAPANYQFVREYRVYDERSSASKLAFVVPATALPTSTVPLNIESIVSRSSGVTWNTGFSYSHFFRITVVSTGGKESAGLTSGTSFASGSLGGRAPYVVQDEASLVLSNDLNSNIVIPDGPPLLIMTGPTGAASIGGFKFSGGVGPAVVRCRYSGGQTITLVNADASSTASYRILTGFGANLVPQGPFEFQLSHNATDDRWILDYFQDSRLRFIAGNGTELVGDLLFNDTYGDVGIDWVFLNRTTGAIYRKSATGDIHIKPQGDLRIETGRLVVGNVAPTSPIQVPGLPVYANNAAAVTGGLTVGAFYRTGADPDAVCVTH